ncbi:Beta-galactosidase C-terminal domain, partial [Lactobacillus gasseri]|nr:Beta-galactosidase C-terminal domain [Lactobacillus gasseri]
KRVTQSGQELYFVLNMSNEERKLPQKFVKYKNILTGQQAHDQMETVKSFV